MKRFDNDLYRTGRWVLRKIATILWIFRCFPFSTYLVIANEQQNLWWSTFLNPTTTVLHTPYSKIISPCTAESTGQFLTMVMFILLHIQRNTSTILFYIYTPLSASILLITLISFFLFIFLYFDIVVFSKFFRENCKYFLKVNYPLDSFSDSGEGLISSLEKVISVIAADGVSQDVLQVAEVEVLISTSQILISKPVAPPIQRILSKNSIDSGVVFLAAETLVR